MDVEAAGPIPGDYSLLSIGACSVDDPGRTFYAELQPISTRFVPDALAVTGLSLEQLAASGEPPAAAMVAFSEWVAEVTAEAEPVFVGFNAGFDWSFVNWYFHHFAVENPFGIGAVDIKSYFMGMSGGDWSSTRSSRLPSRFLDTRSGTTSHNAREDAIAQAGVFARMRAEAARP